MITVIGLGIRWPNAYRPPWPKSWKSAPNQPSSLWWTNRQRQKHDILGRCKKEWLASWFAGWWSIALSAQIGCISAICHIGAGDRHVVQIHTHSLTWSLSF